MVQINARIKKTKDNLKLSLLKLLAIKQIDEITIKELCDTANIQRGTFYRHYINITELYEEIINEDLTQITTFFSSLQSSSLNIADIKNILNFIKERNTFLFIAYSPSIKFDGFNSNLKNSCIKNMSETMNADLSDPESFNTLNFMYAGIYEYIAQWVKSDYAASVDEVARHIYILLEALSDTLPEN